jgi:hypothetical protein
LSPALSGDNLLKAKKAEPPSSLGKQLSRRGP